MEAAGNGPVDVRGDQKKSYRRGYIGRRGAKVAAPLWVKQRNQEQGSEQGERIVLGEQGQRTHSACPDGKAQAPRLQRLEEEVGQPRPRAQEGSVGVEAKRPHAERRRQ